MKRLLLAVALLFAAHPIVAGAAVPGLEVVPEAAPTLTGIPLRNDVPDEEQWERFFGQTMVRNVTRPMLYPVLPRDGKANGKSVIVVPGGGYLFLSMELEGFLVAQRLAAAGYTAFVLKYRPEPTDRDPERFMTNAMKLFGNLGRSEVPACKPALDDLAEAVRLVSAEAPRWKLNPSQIGVIGFSAGALTAIRLVERQPEAKLLRHVGLIYPPMGGTLSGGVRPSLFLAVAANDPLFIQGGLSLVDQWLKESRKIEFHLYSSGGHGFGMRSQRTTSDHWIEQYLDWLALQ